MLSGGPIDRTACGDCRFEGSPLQFCGNSRRVGQRFPISHGQRKLVPPGPFAKRLIYRQKMWRRGQRYPRRRVATFWPPPVIGQFFPLIDQRQFVLRWVLNTALCSRGQGAGSPSARGFITPPIREPWFLPGGSGWRFSRVAPPRSFWASGGLGGGADRARPPAISRGRSLPESARDPAPWA